MAEVETPASPLGAGETGIVVALTRAASLVAAGCGLYLVLILFVEWRTLQRDEAGAASNVVIGYVGIHPNLSYAKRPGPWFEAEADRVRLWGGWVKGVGHSWFLTGTGDVDPKTLAPPIGRDVFPAIDYPIEESNGGQVWGRIPDDAAVIGLSLSGVETAYPVLVLEKVGLVNDTIAGRPYLITYNPLGSEAPPTAVYAREVDGKVVTLGHSGYFQGRKPLFYDRGTESLWVAGGGALRAVAGSYKGRTLPGVGGPTPVSWSLWKGKHPGGRVVIGSDRSRPRPEA